MAEPDLVARCVEAMSGAVDIPISVKTRIGINDQPEGPAVEAFVRTVGGAGCTRFTIHARKAWLKGLSPKENRDVPPLNYPVVYALKEQNPGLSIAVNGGIVNCKEIHAHLTHVDGVMLGRAAYQDCFILSGIDRLFFDRTLPELTRRSVLEAMEPYIEEKIAEGLPLSSITRHMLGLFVGIPGAKHWRRSLTEGVRESGVSFSYLEQTLSEIENEYSSIAA